MYHISTFYDSDGNRWYRDPSNPSQVYAGVTSILNVRNAEALNKAKVNGVAKYAAHNRKILAEGTQASTYALLKEQNVVLPDWKVATDFGTAAHQVLDNHLNKRPLDHKLEHVEGTDTYPVSNTFTEFVPQYWEEFVAAHNVKYVMGEQVVASDEYGYAGRFDLVLEVDGEVAIVDAKSNKNGPNAKVALQNIAYARCPEWVDMANGRRTPMPEITQSYVWWVREEGWNLFPLEFTDQTFDDFLKHLNLFAFGATGREDQLIGAPIHSDNIQPVKRFFR